MKFSDSLQAQVFLKVEKSIHCPTGFKQAIGYKKIDLVCSAVVKPWDSFKGTFCPKKEK